MEKKKPKEITSLQFSLHGLYEYGMRDWGDIKIYFANKNSLLKNKINDEKNIIWK